jgi:predicted nucleic acid-binding Zn ribbon protein
MPRGGESGAPVKGLDLQLQHEHMALRAAAGLVGALAPVVSEIADGAETDTQWQAVLQAARRLAAALDLAAVPIPREIRIGGCYWCSDSLPEDCAAFCSADCEEAHSASAQKARATDVSDLLKAAAEAQHILEAPTRECDQPRIEAAVYGLRNAILKAEGSR